ncbi:MAG: tyrosine-type recombinase/integrase [Planctomycetota bacterium]
MAWIRWRNTQRGRLAYAQWRDPEGRVRSEPTNTSDPELAKAILNSVQAEREGKPPVTERLTAQQAVDRFLAYVKLCRSKQTHAFYARRLQTLLDAWKAVPLERWSRAMLESLVARNDWLPRTIQMLRNVAKRFRGWAQEAGIACPDVVGRFKGPTVQRSDPKALSGDELAALLKEAHGHALEPAIAMAALAGLRYAELRAVEAKDVDWKRGDLIIRGSKAHTDRRVPMSEPLREVLARAGVAAGPVVRFSTHSNAVRALKLRCTKAGIHPVAWHALRHTYGTRLAATGADLPTIQRRAAGGPQGGLPDNATKRREALDSL